MSLLCFASSVVLSMHINQFNLHNLATRKRISSNPSLSFVHYRFSRDVVKNICINFRNKLPINKKFTAGDSLDSYNETFTDVSFDWENQGQEDTEDVGSPWEGAIIYNRNPSILHVEYCTTLERLGLGKLSTEISKSRASLMGLRVTKAVKDYPLGTPVQISIGVTRKKQKLRLDGIIKTVITLGCNRCGEPAAECIFSNFSLLLTEEPIEEPNIINMGTIYGRDKFKSSTTVSEEEEEDDDEASIVWDDRLYFPSEEKEIDISKPIRDLVHVEVTINAICDPSCKGLCFQCGTNLNKSSCTCSKENVEERGYAPLKNLRKQMQQPKTSV